MELPISLNHRSPLEDGERQKALKAQFDSFAFRKKAHRQPRLKGIRIIQRSKRGISGRSPELERRLSYVRVIPTGSLIARQDKCKASAFRMDVKPFHIRMRELIESDKIV